MRLRPISIALVLLSAITLNGCGGGGAAVGTGAFQNLTVTPVNATVNLPAGPTPVTAMKVWTSAGETTPSAAGAASVNVFNNGPQYSEVRDANGNTVAAGFVGSNRATLDLQSTAEAFTYFAIGGPLQRGSRNSQSMVLESVKSLQGFAGVLQAVTASYNAKGHVSAEEPAIKTALVAVRQALLTNPANPKGPSVDPTTSASGLEIDNDVNDEIRITNTAFRRSYMWLIRTGFKDSNGNTRELAEGIASEPILMPGRYGGSVDSATGLIKGQYSWEPYAMDPHPVSSDIADADNEEEVYYDLVTVGVGRTAGDFADLTQEQFAKWEELVYWTAYLDFYLPVFANLVLPLDGSALDSVAEFAYNHTLAKNFVAGARSSMPNVSSLTAQGKFPSALNSFVTSSQMPSITEMTTKIMLAWGQTVGKPLFRDEQDLISRVKTAENRVGMIALTDAVSEMAPLLDLHNADQANIFKIVSSRSSVKLVTDAEEVGLDDTANIEAIIKNKQTGVTYRYEWTVSSTNFFLQDVAGNSTDQSPGGVLKSAHEKVFIGNLSNNEGTPTITCRVYNGNTLIGTANTTVRFRDNVKEGTATFIIKHVLTPNAAGTGYNYAVYAIAETPKVQDADHYAIVVEKANGEDVTRKNWAATSNPPVGHPKIWTQKPEGVYWVTIDGTYLEGYTSLENAQKAINEITQGFENEYAGIKMKVTVYFD